MSACLTLRRSTLIVPWLLAFVAALMAGCATVPQREFKAYREAFEAAKVSGEEVVLDFSAASQDEQRRAQARAARVPAAASAPFAFNYTLTSGMQVQSQADPARVRLRALQAIARYNQVLADLAEGKSPEEVASSAAQLVQVISAFTQVAPGVGPLAADFAAALERARTRAEFVAAVRKGEVPVANILDFLVADIPLFYDLRRTLAMQDLRVIEDRIRDRANRLQAAASAVDPAAKVELAEYETRINDDLSRLGGMDRRLRLVRASRPGPAASAAQNALTNAVLEDARIAFAADGDSYLTVIARLNAYHSVLQRYESMLAATRSAMVGLRLAIDGPHDPVPQLDELLQTALMLRRDLLQARRTS